MGANLSILQSEEVYSSICTTLGEKLDIGKSFVVNGQNLFGVEVTRANTLLVKDDLGFIYRIDDVCLTSHQDEQIRAICFDCEYFWYRKYKNREYKLIGKTKEHDVLFRNKVSELSGKLNEEISDVPMEKVPIRYLTFVSNYIKDLSLIDKKLVIYLEDDVSYMIGTLKRVGEDGGIILLFSNFDEEDNKVYLEGGIISKKEVKQVVNEDIDEGAFKDVSFNIEEYLMRESEGVII